MVLNATDMIARMRVAVYALVVVFILAVVVRQVVCAQGGPGTDAPEDGIARYRNADSLRKLVSEAYQPYVLIDVRTGGESAGGFIPTAINIPVQVIARNPPQIATDSLVVVYCRTGNRSASAKRILQQQGFTHVVDFGGINRWPFPLAQ